MALSNRERLTKALDHITTAYRPWVWQRLQAAYGDHVEERIQDFFNQTTVPGFRPKSQEDWDVQVLLNLILGMWPSIFRHEFDATQRNLLHELKTIRNDWAHQKKGQTDDTIRALDTIARLLSFISAREAEEEVRKMYGDVMRARFGEMERTATHQAQRRATAGKPMSGLKPWREIMSPHPDVRDGSYAQAEFAADLAQVHRGDAVEEYGNAKEFFRRTYLTNGLRSLIVNALRRLNGKGGDPVIELQTNFGGGKTHSMLALYHLTSGVNAVELPGVEELMAQEQAQPAPAGVKRAVLVGTAFSPGEVETPESGVEVRTFWGRMAYQLGGRAALDLLRDSDRQGTAPGSDTLVKLFQFVGPCLILIDEWVAFCRQTYEVHGLPGGSFDANLTFAQALTEAVRACPQALLVASLPQSKIEVGGSGGQLALASLEDTFGRIEFNWAPAEQDESYEIVRRRLFEPIHDPSLHADRDAVISAYFQHYLKNKADFPSAVSAGEYEGRMLKAYPIHPELFDRLYNDWSSLEEFQRTRGVLRLMAMVIHTLWKQNDRSLMIMPGLLPLDESNVMRELTRYLPTNWPVIMQSEIDGENALATRLDNENSRFGEIWATRRVARTVYMSSAPSDGKENKGTDLLHLRLGCLQPGENASVFGDALGRLQERASHLYSDGTRYWYASQPNILTSARDRMHRISTEEKQELIVRTLKEEARQRHEFQGVHTAPESSGEVPDDPATRLVILSPKSSHLLKNVESSAAQVAHELLQQRGNSPRLYRNSLVFLAPDRVKLDQLLEAAGWLLAWGSIWEEREPLGLDPFNVQMAKTRMEESRSTLQARLPEAYCWILVPVQTDPAQKWELDFKRTVNGDSLAERVWRKLAQDSQVADVMAGTILKIQLDRYLWRDQRDHVKTTELAEYFAQYPYLPRLKDRSVLEDSIRSGTSSLIWVSEGFAYADHYDEAQARYVGLQMGTHLARVAFDGQAVLVKSEVAEQQRQRDSEEVRETSPQIQTPAGAPPVTAPLPGVYEGPPQSPSATPAAPARSHRYYGQVELDAVSAKLQFGNMVDELLIHFTRVYGTRVTVTVDIRAESDDGFSTDLERIIKENAKSLKFNESEFE